jgi:hypothetical protein
MLHPSYPRGAPGLARDEPTAPLRQCRMVDVRPEYVWFRLTGERASTSPLPPAAASSTSSRCNGTRTPRRRRRPCTAAVGTRPCMCTCHPASTRRCRVMAGLATPPGGCPWATAPARTSAAAARRRHHGPHHRNVRRSAHDAALARRARARPRRPVALPPRCDHAVLGGASPTAGSSASGCKRTLRLPDDEAGSTRSSSRTARRSRHRRAAVPRRRAQPRLAARRPAVFAGVRLGTDAARPAAGGMEAVAYRLALLRRRIREEVPQAGSVVASGAALQRSVLDPLVADVFGEPVHVTAEEEASSRGAAMLALLHAGVSMTSDICRPRRAPRAARSCSATRCMRRDGAAPAPRRLARTTSCATRTLIRRAGACTLGVGTGARAEGAAAGTPGALRVPAISLGAAAQPEPGKAWIRAMPPADAGGPSLMHSGISLRAAGPHTGRPGRAALSPPRSRRRPVSLRPRRYRCPRYGV